MQLAELYEKCNAEKLLFENKINARKQSILLQLLAAAGETHGRELMKQYTSLPHDPIQAVRLCRQYSEQLNDLAIRCAGENKNIPDAIKRIATQREFLKSPLGSFLCLPQKKQLQHELQQDERIHKQLLGNFMKLEKTFLPDTSGIFEFAYMPPGGFLSKDGKLQQIDYPFWVAPQKLNVRQFSRICRFLPPNSRDQELPAVRFLWNDLIHGCSNANKLFQISAPFLPGYIVRPLTDAEWEYVASRSAGVSGKSGDGAGVFDLGGNISEIIASGKYDFRDSVLARANDGKKREVVFYQSFVKNLGTRLAVAPGNVEFYQQKSIHGSPQHIVFNGKHYEFFGHLCANFSRGDAERICRLLGGRLAAMDSPELLQKMYNAASPVIKYNICVAADFKDGKWRWRNGKIIEKAPPPPKKGDYFVLSGKRFTTKISKRYLGFICEWTEEEFKARKNWKARVDSLQFPAVKTFHEDGKEYAFFKILMSYPHLCRRFAEILGGKLAEPENPALQKKIGEHLKGFDAQATLLGGYWRDGRFFWNSSRNEIKDHLPITGQLIDPAPSLSVPAIKNGKLCAIQLPEQFLVEFSAPEATPE